MAFLSALHTKNNISLLSIDHHGDSINNRYISGLTQEEKVFILTLKSQFYLHFTIVSCKISQLLIESRDIAKQKNGKRRLESKRLMPMVSVCHSEPGKF